MISVLAALLLLVSQADTGRLAWVPNPRIANGGWVSDPANHLRAETVAQINALAASLEQQTTVELAVVVIDSLDGLEPADAALRLHRRWGVGKATRDNGIVLLWSPALRKIFASVGSGLEGVLPDARAGRIQDEAMLPAFRRNDFDAGMFAGAQALADAAREETYSGLERNQAARPAVERGRSKPRFIASIIGGVFTVVLGMLGLGMLWRRFPRRCRKGHGWMRRLSEQKDDAEIGAEGVLEERLGSVNYDVWACATCNERTILPYPKIFSKYSKCPQCKRVTCETISKVIVKATYSASGRRKVRRECKNCAFRDEEERTIPKLERSSSSGSSGSSGGGSSSGGGGSSFGGGSSGGGGAGRSY